MKLLLVEDEDILAKYIAKALRGRGNIVDLCSNGERAVGQILQSESYGAIILDVVLPGLDGFSVCEKVRREGCATPIIFLSSKDTPEDRIQGLQKGGDDYLIKPFHIEELCARLQALQRRVGAAPKNSMTHEHLFVDIASRTVSVDGEVLKLRPKEFDLLAYLLSNRGRIVTREELLKNLWSGTRADSTSNRVEVCVRSLRSKIDIPYGKTTIVTRHKSGYQIN